MSSRPSALPVWGTAGAIVIPPSLKQQLGWVAGEYPPAEYENWRANLVYQWIQHLADGDISLNNVTVGGSLGVTGLLTASGGITVPTGLAVVLAGSTGITVGGAATVGGLLTASDGLAMTGAVNIPGLSPAQNTIIGAAGIEQVPDATKVSRVGPQLRFAGTRTGGNGILYPIVLPVGSTLATMKIVYNRAGNTLAFSIVAQDLDTGGAASSAQVLVNDSSTTGIQAATVSNFAVDGSGHPTGASGTLTARADRAYWILAECTYTSGTPIIYGLSINA